MVALKRGPGRVADEGRKEHEDDGGLQPPPVLAHGFAEAAADYRKLRVRHSRYSPWGAGVRSVSADGGVVRPAGARASRIFEAAMGACQCHQRLGRRGAELLE